MSNEEFLLNYLSETVTKPDRLALLIGIFAGVLMFLCLVLTGASLFERGGSCWLWAILFVVNCFVATTNMVTWETSKQTYETQMSQMQETNKERLEERKTYDIYLNSEPVEYDKVMFSQYHCDIDDENKTIYLATKG